MCGRIWFVLFCVLFLASFLGGCCCTARANRLGQYNFDYHVSNAKNTGITQVFDDGVDTYLVFKPLVVERFHPGIFSGDREIVGEVIGEKVRIKGLHGELFVLCRGQRSRVFGGF